MCCARRGQLPFATPRGPTSRSSRLTAGLPTPNAALSWWGGVRPADVEAELASGSVSTATLRSPSHPEAVPSPSLLEMSTPSPAQAGSDEAIHHTTSGPPPAPASDKAPAGPTPGAAEKPESAKGQVEVVELI